MSGLHVYNGRNRSDLHQSQNSGHRSRWHSKEDIDIVPVYIESKWYNRFGLHLRQNNIDIRKTKKTKNVHIVSVGTSIKTLSIGLVYK